MRARCLSAARLNSVSLTELLSVCRSVRPSVCPPVASANPAQLGTAPACLPPSPPVPPRPSVPVCPGPARVKLHRHDRGKKGEKRAEKKEKRGKRERKRYSQSSTRPLRCSLSPLSPTLSGCRSIRAAPSCCRGSLTSSATRWMQALPVDSFKIKP